jgi:hypothetical protein
MFKILENEFKTKMNPFSRDKGRDGNFAPIRPDPNRTVPTRAGITRPVEMTGRLRFTKIAPIPGAGRSRILLDPPRPAPSILQNCPSL